MTTPASSQQQGECGSMLGSKEAPVELEMAKSPSPIGPDSEESIDAEMKMEVDYTGTESEETIDAEIKMRVDCALESCNLPKERCTVLNVSNSSGLQYTHCLTAIDARTRDNLEYNWNMKLNFDTRWNVLPLNPSSHYQFSKGLFFLIPEECVIKNFEEAIVFGSHNPPVLQVPRDGFKYKVLPHPHLKGHVLYRQHQIPSKFPASVNDYTCHEYPYSTLDIRSHVQPCYIICHIGRKMSTVSSFLAMLPRSPNVPTGHLCTLAARCSQMYHYWSTSETTYMKAMKARVLPDYESSSSRSPSASFGGDDGSGTCSGRACPQKRQDNEQLHSTRADLFSWIEEWAKEVALESPESQDLSFIDSKKGVENVDQGAPVGVDSQDITVQV